MTRFRYAQVHWLVFIFGGFITSASFRWLQNQFGFGMITVLLVLTIGLIAYYVLGKIFLSVVKFKDSYVLFKGVMFRKDLVVDYAAINKITFTYDRFLNLHIYTEGNKIKLPSPGRLANAEELFRWLHAQNPAIETEIIKPKTNDD